MCTLATQKTLICVQTAKVSQIKKSPTLTTCLVTVYYTNLQVNRLLSKKKKSSSLFAIMKSISGFALVLYCSTILTKFSYADMVVRAWGQNPTSDIDILASHVIPEEQLEKQSIAKNIGKVSVRLIIYQVICFITIIYSF